jgi:hypothetical protein
VKGYLRENPQVAQEIERKIYDTLGVEPASPLSVIESPPSEVEEGADEEAPEGPMAEEQAA